MQIEEEGCYPPRVKAEVDNIYPTSKQHSSRKMFCVFILFARSVLVRNSAISASDNRERHFRKTLTSTRLWHSAVLVKTRIWVKGCSVSRAHKIWSRPFLFKDFRHFLFLAQWCINSMAAAPDRYHIWKIPLIRWYIAPSSKYGRHQLKN